MNPITEAQAKQIQTVTVNALKCFVGLQINIDKLAALKAITASQARKEVENYVKGLSGPIDLTDPFPEETTQH